MSGTALYDSAMIVCYPVLYSFLPVLYFGILDQSVQASTANTYPQSYYVGQQGRHLNLQQMCMWECKALLHAGLISLLTFNAWGLASSNPYAEGAGSITTHADGTDADMYTVGPLPTTPTTPAPTHPTHLPHRPHLSHLAHLPLPPLPPPPPSYPPLRGQVGAAVNFMVVVTVNAKLLLSMNAHTRHALSNPNPDPNPNPSPSPQP